MATASSKIRVAVLYGGRSAEHEVSLNTAKNVIQYLDKSLFDVTPIGIDKKGNWFIGDDVFQKSLAQYRVPAKLEYEPTWFSPMWVSCPSEGLVGEVENTKAFDVVFPAVHGTYCEDGTLQGLLELANLPYVGCGVLSSSIGMDKEISKLLAQQAHIPVAPFFVARIHQWKTNPDKIIAIASASLTFPLFVKPANTGSSIGISKVKDKASLKKACEEAFAYDTKILIEQGIQCHEIELAVLESREDKDNPIVSVVGEIKPSHEFYSYDAKYVDENGAELCIPAKLPEAVIQTARDYAKRIFKALQCEGMARVDLFYDAKTNVVYFNEINTLPGFTKISMYPKLLEASGISYSNLLTHLIYLAMDRHKLRSQLRTTKELEQLA